MPIYYSQKLKLLNEYIITQKKFFNIRIIIMLYNFRNINYYINIL